MFLIISLLLVLIGVLYYIAHCLHVRNYADIPGYSTPIPLFWIYMFKKDFPLRVQTLIPKVFAKYNSPLVRITTGCRTVVICCDSQTLKQMLVTERPEFLKHRVGAPPPTLGINVFFADGEEWRRQRVLLSHAFTDVKLRDIHDHSMVPVGHRLIQKWNKVCAEGNSKVAMPAEFSEFTFDVIGTAGFGVDFDSMTNGPNQTWLGLLDDQRMQRMLGRKFYRGLGPLLCKCFKRFRDIAENRDAWINLVRSTVKTGKEKAAEGTLADTSLLAVLLKGQQAENAQKLSDSELASNVSLLMVAGHETSSNTLAWVLLHLAKDLNLQKKIREETSELFMGVEDPDNGMVIPDFDKIMKEMQHTKAIIMEVLRLYGPAHVLLRHLARDRVICGKRIPAATDLLISLTALHRNEEKYGKDASEFNYERWIGANSHAVDVGYAPFSTGARRCIGQRFAEVEMISVLALILYYFDLSIEPKEAEAVQPKITVTLSPSTFQVNLKRRAQ